MWQLHARARTWTTTTHDHPSVSAALFLVGQLTFIKMVLCYFSNANTADLRWIDPPLKNTDFGPNHHFLCKDIS